MSALLKPVDLRTYPQWCHLELINWARWCWLGAWPHPLPPEHCGSGEGWYSRISEEGTADDARPIPPNVTHARIVQSVWEKLPNTPKLVLRAEYPQRFESGRVEFGRAGAARFVHLPLHDYERALGLSIAHVIDAFEARH